jgi:hypothetical protein
MEKQEPRAGHRRKGTQLQVLPILKQTNMIFI